MSNKWDIAQYIRKLREKSTAVQDKNAGKREKPANILYRMQPFSTISKSAIQLTATFSIVF